MKVPGGVKKNSTLSPLAAGFAVMAFGDEMTSALLIQAALNRGGKDNVSMILAHALPDYT